MVTIRDIAKRLGLSVSTVSRALNDNKRISIKTRRNVHQMAEKLGYQPNYNAKNLTNREANTVGVVFPVNNRVVDNIFYVGILRGMNAQLNQRNYVLSIAIGDSTEQVIDNVKSMITRAQIKHFILLYSHQNDPVIEMLQNEDVDFVTIGKPAAGQDWLYVDNDNVKAGFDGANFLINEFHAQNPVFVQTHNDWPFEIDRRKGYLDAINQAGKQPIVFSIPDADDGVPDQFIKDHPQMDGIVAIDDYSGLKMYHRFKMIYPDKDIEVLGYNNSLPAELTDTHFHSVDIHPGEMGKSAVQLLLDKPEDGEAANRHIIVGHQIV
ncbi:LacI family DNA-binding transcriptional regulator [Lentilactobacillus parabuchneri]|uniref:LacI family DNA-binding transcriptional regulator n=1 Tax=Lentilactobacillus parabuchneri TaxID=152331 RepID=UPI00070C63BD|nr:LacI family DNA-binding transcriptional regulator [Lentilactobacillus parabuchneri]KRN78490.1 lacI family transcriptional regulator [Lentilactobacillus parabuchneri]